MGKGLLGVGTPGEVKSPPPLAADNLLAGLFGGGGLPKAKKEEGKEEK